MKVEVQDKAGNKTAKQTKSSTTNIPPLYDDKKAQEQGTIANVTIEKSEEDWTNQDIILKVELDKEVDPEGKYEIEYSKDGGETWEKYEPETGIVVEENTEVEIRLTDGENSGESVIVEVNNIDKIAPELELQTKGRSNSITVNAKAIDNLSGIKQYIYYIGKQNKEGNIIWEKGISTKDPEYTFNGLEQDTEYFIKVEVEDKAANKTEKQTKQKTEKIPTLYDEEKAKEKEEETGEKVTPNITVEKSEEDWTNQDVIVKVELAPELNLEGEYEIEYSKDGGETWEKYDSEVGIIVEDNTNLEVRLTDGENTGEGITIKVDNIDKVAPTLEISATGTSSTITVRATAEDKLSGIKNYTYYIGTKDKEGNIIWQEGTTKEEAIHTFTGVKQDTDYYVKVEVQDKARNQVSKDTKVHTDKIPDLYDDKKAEETEEETGEKVTPNITVEKSEKDWTNQDVIVTVEVDKAVGPEGKYDLEYSKDGGATWEKYDPETEIVVEENTEVEIRLTDGTNHGDGIKVEIANIDKIPPQVVLNAEVTKTSITANVTVIEENSGIKEYIYYIGTKDEKGNIIWQEGIKSQEEHYTFENLEDNTSYEIKVEVVDHAGNKGMAEKEVTTMEEIISSNYITITQDTKKWTKGNVIVTITAKESSYITEFSLDGTIWEEFINQKQVTMTENGTVYARVRQGGNQGDVISLTITNIDKIAPKVQIIPEEITSKSFKVKLETSDEIGGIAKVIWYYRPSYEETYTQQSYQYAVIGSNEKGKESLEKEYEYHDLVRERYYVCAEITDVAGNVTVTDTICIEPIEITTGEEGIVFTSNTNWTNQDIVVNIASKDERYTVLSSLDGENWTSALAYTIPENMVVYAKLYDGINSGETVGYTVDHIDKEKAKAQMKLQEVTSKSFIVEMDIQDNSSGLAKIKWYYKNQNETTYQEEEEIFMQVGGAQAGENHTHKEFKKDNLEKGIYEVYAIITDVAGNRTVVGKESVEGEENIPPEEKLEIELIEIVDGKSTITLTPSTNNWTNQPITVTATNTDKRYQVQMSLNETQWETEETIEVQQNGTVFVRLTDGINYGKSTKLAIQNIDISSAIVNITNGNVTSKTFTVQANIEDNSSGLGKIDWYMRKRGETQYQKTTKEYQVIGGKEAGELETIKEITYQDLTSGTYEVYAVITDVAGNVTTTTKIEVTLTTITSGANGIQITSSNENWTNQDVQLTAVSTDERYTVQTSEDGSNWLEEASRNYSENGIMYARLTDGINVGSVTSKQITNIDKQKAQVTVKNTEITSRSFTQKVDIVDHSSGLGKIEVYYKEQWEQEYCVKEFHYQQINGTVQGENSATKNLFVDGIKSGTYEIYVVVTDVAGNQTSTIKNSEIITLETITSGQEAITLTPNTTNWTNQPVTVTAESTEEQYQIQMKAKEDEWESRNTITVEENQAVHARLFDGVNGGTMASITINNIDTTLPLAQIECTNITTKSMEIKVTGSDYESGIAQIIWYYQKTGQNIQSQTINYKTINSAEDGEYEVEATKVMENLTSGTYTVYAVITDVAGNSTTTRRMEVTLSTVTSGEMAITLTPNVTHWINRDIRVTAESTDHNFILQMSTDGINWENKIETIVTENKTVYARLFDGINGGTMASLTVGNIDKTPPTVGRIATRANSDTIDVSLTIQDNLSGIAKVIWYYKKEADSNYETITQTYMDMNGTEAGHLNGMISKAISGLTIGKNYHIYAVVYDVAGNYTTTGEVQVTTNTAPTFTSAGVESLSTSNMLTITARATDPDPEDKLTYTLYYGTSTNYGNSKEIANKNSGESVTFSIPLSSYQLYYWKIEVKDKVGAISQGNQRNGRAYCTGTTTCNGPYNPVSCNSCNSTGIITSTGICGAPPEMRGRKIGSTSSNTYTCKECSTKVKGYYYSANQVLRCTQGHYLSSGMTGTFCSTACIYARDLRAPGYCDMGKTITSTCNICNGAKKCTHGYQSSHYHCSSHSYSGSASYHK